MIFFGVHTNYLHYLGGNNDIISKNVIPLSKYKW